ncbi:MAG: hypothetical protein HQK50_11185 [Oligoflexia bacterium]|nr:hypothetical protein [Oligoflexia bacterium]
MQDDKKSHSDGLRKENAREHLINNYIYFVDKIFKKNKINIASILSSDNSESNLLAYDKEKKSEQLVVKGESLKDEIVRNPSGHTSKDLWELTHLTSLKNSEQLLKRNPFYYFAQELFICLHHASRNYFIASMKQLCGYSPKKIEHSEYMVLKILNVLTFLVSSYTTAYGVNHLLQKNDLAILSSFNGNEGEIPRVMLSLVVGCLLSLIIFHLKSNLFRGILSAGKIFDGIKQVYLKHPWKIVFATLVLSLSLKTNYDGGVALISKAEYINEQYRLITHQATVAYERSNSGQSNSISSFQQSVDALKQFSEDTVVKFKKFPSEEDEGVASSGFSGQGARYRGKSFVVEGGYDKDKSSVVAVRNFTNQDLAREVDDIIQTSGIDFSISLETKIKRLISNYETSVNFQKKQVEGHLLELDNLVKGSNRYLPRFVSISFVEYYDLNRLVKEMAKSFVLTAQQYDETVSQLQFLINQHIQVLTRIDRAGNARARNYKISLVLPSMNVSEVLALTKGLPEVRYLSFEELITLLNSKYGLMWAQLVMLFILVMSVLIDLADVIFMSPSLAYRGRRELEMLSAKEDEINDWEEKFLKQCYLFLYDDDVAQIHNRLIPGKSIFLVDAFYQLLEEANPMVMDTLDKKISTNVLNYLKSDFRPLHAHATNNYNERAKAIEIIVKNKEYYLNRYLELTFPCLKEILMQTDFSFEEIDRRVQSRQNEILNRLLERVEFLSCEADKPSFYYYFKKAYRVKKIKKLDSEIEQKLEKLKINATTDDFMDYNRLRIDNLVNKRMMIKNELASLARELNELTISARNYLTKDGEEVSKWMICKKMVTSFISILYSTYSENNVVSKILSRRKWLLSMGHRIARPQTMEGPLEQKVSLRKAA